MSYPNADTGSLASYFLANQQLQHEVEAAKEQLPEQLAALAHEQWSGWIRYMFGKAPLNADGTWTMPAELVQRWQRQMTTAYDDLPESEKESDRVEAAKVIAILDELGL